MRQPKGFTLVELLVVVGIIGLLAAMLVPSLQYAIEEARRKMCMANLRTVATAIILYRQHNDDRGPWIPNVTSDWASVATGTNRQKTPAADANNAGERSITAVMFLLVRDRQRVDLFLCPSDEEAAEDKKVTWDHDGDVSTPEVYYWDFASDRNVSYSWQGPILRGGKYVNGVSDEGPDAIIMGEKTPACGDPAWRPVAMTDEMTHEQARRNMSRTHRGEVVNLLRADLAIAAARRADVGVAQDFIYTASNRKVGGARDSVDLDLSHHLSRDDTFLIGPVGEAGEAGAD